MTDRIPRHPSRTIPEVKHRFDPIDIPEAVRQMAEQRRQAREQHQAQADAGEIATLVMWALILLAIALGMVRYALPDPPRTQHTPAEYATPAEKDGRE